MLSDPLICKVNRDWLGSVGFHSFAYFMCLALERFGFEQNYGTNLIASASDACISTILSLFNDARGKNIQKSEIYGKVFSLAAIFYQQS